jgi:hypothetical protein
MPWDRTIKASKRDRNRYRRPTITARFAM